MPLATTVSRPYNSEMPPHKRPMLEYDIIWGYHKMVVRTPRIVGQHIIIPKIVKSSGGSGKQWTLFVILFLSALLAMVSTGLEVDESS